MHEMFYQLVIQSEGTETLVVSRISHKLCSHESVQLNVATNRPDTLCGCADNGCMV